MNPSGDIIVIEDDADDRQILIDIFEEIMDENNYSNRLVIVEEPTSVMGFLKGKEADPFIIISDINMPKVNGFDLRNQIFSDHNIREKAIPFIFLTTSGNNEEYIKHAYSLSIQGYFAKPRNYPEYKKLLSGILSYWKMAKMA